LKENQYPVQLIREPGGSQISEQIRAILLDNQNDNMHPTTELLLYESARAQLIDETIRPGLNRNEILISDRFMDSTLAYQGYGRLISLSTIQKINELVCGKIYPDRTYFLDISWEISLQRRSLLSKDGDRMEKEQMDFFNRVRNGYLQIMENEPDRVCLLDGSKSVTELEQEIFQDVMIVLKKTNH
jgi:dTMP kinase